MNEIFKPRFKQIADYPGSKTRKGDILICPDYDNQFTVDYWVKDKESYPQIFQKLYWYEERKECELPKYVIMFHTKTIHKVSYKEFLEGKIWIDKSNGHNINDYWWLTHALPIFESDYERYGISIA